MINYLRIEVTEVDDSVPYKGLLRWYSERTIETKILDLKTEPDKALDIIKAVVSIAEIGKDIKRDD